MGYGHVPVDMLPWEQTYGGGGVPAPTVLRDGTVIPAPPRRMPVIQPYYTEKPPSGQDFYFNETGVLAAGAGSTLVLPAAGPLLINPNFEGVIKSVVIFIDAPLTTLDIVWQLRVNGGGVVGWDALRTFPRTANNLSIEFSGTVQVPGSSKIDVLITNNNAVGPWTVGAEVSGWAWPVADRVRVFGEGS